MRLYRPVGLDELLPIYESEMTAFPPRLPDQPIFYPVLNAPYAVQIARQWNTRSNTFAGYVTQFDIADDYAARGVPQYVVPDSDWLDEPAFHQVTISRAQLLRGYHDVLRYPNGRQAHLRQ